MSNWIAVSTNATGNIVATMTITQAWSGAPKRKSPICAWNARDHERSVDKLIGLNVELAGTHEILNAIQDLATARILWAMVACAFLRWVLS